MAIPNAFASEPLLLVRDYFDTLELSDLLPLQKEDAYLIGAFVQVFNFIELNLRRSLDVFCSAGLIERKKHFQTSELVKLVKSGLEKAGVASQHIDDALAKLDEIELRRPFRNLLAHWAAKRISTTHSDGLPFDEIKDATSNC